MLWVLWEYQVATVCCPTNHLCNCNVIWNRCVFCYMGVLLSEAAVRNVGKTRTGMYVAYKHERTIWEPSHFGTVFTVKRYYKVFLVHVMKAYRGSRSIALLILNLSTRWKWMVNFTHQLLYSWEGTPNIHWLEDWMSPIAAVDIMEKKNLLPLPGFEP
jgi:hypothetical protein